MGQEFIIKSQQLEDKINQLLPSQGGFQAGVDLSASTTVIPIVDLTETAEGSQVRQDLQTALSLNDVNNFQVSNTTTTLVSTTGYYRIFGVSSARGNYQNNFRLTDGISTKTIWGHWAEGNVQFDFVVFIPAGQSLLGQTTNASAFLNGIAKQIADINGNLTEPS